MSDAGSTPEPPALFGSAPLDHDGAGHRGVLAARCLVAVRSLARGVPPTALEVHFGRLPTADVDLRVERLDVLRAAVTADADGGEAAADAVIELAGHDVGPRVPDLEELGRRPLPPVAPSPAPGCWGCGTEGQLQHRPVDAGTTLATCAVDERGALGDDVDPAVLVALLTCPATWLAAGRPPDHLVVRFFGRAAAFEPLRLAARRDPSDDDVVRTRGAIVDDGGAVVAVAATTHPR